MQFLERNSQFPGRSEELAVNPMGSGVIIYDAENPIFNTGEANEYYPVSATTIVVSALLCTK